MEKIIFLYEVTVKLGVPCLPYPPAIDHRPAKWTLQIIRLVMLNVHDNIYFLYFTLCNVTIFL